jgi:hypothetical protein
MIDQVTAIPLRFYQLAILNMGLIVAISKELSFLYIISSLIFIAVVIAPLAIWFNLLENPAQIIHEEIQLQMKQGWKQFVKCLSSWGESDDTKKTKYVVMVNFHIFRV